MQKSRFCYFLPTKLIKSVILFSYQTWDRIILQDLRYHKCFWKYQLWCNNEFCSILYFINKSFICIGTFRNNARGWGKYFLLDFEVIFFFNSINIFIWRTPRFAIFSPNNIFISSIIPEWPSAQLCPIALCSLYSSASVHIYFDIRILLYVPGYTHNR